MKQNKKAESIFWICIHVPLPILTVSLPMWVILCERLLESFVMWWEAPLSVYHKESCIMEGFPKINEAISTISTLNN